MRPAALLFASIVASLTHAGAPDTLIPVVPASKARANLVPPPAVKPQGSRSVNTGVPEADAMRSTITMASGVNEIVKVAVTHLNRIVTPYEEPVVTTTASVEPEIRDNVIYIATPDETPLTLFITEKGSEEQALSLTLIPRQIPPREIFLTLAKGKDTHPVVSRKAEQWEKSQPYLLTIQNVFRAVALGAVPSGYTLAQPTPEVWPTCWQTGLKFDFTHGQVLMGHNLVVHVGVAENIAPSSIEFMENTCGNWDVAAAAAFPRNVLDPGEKTEIYVARKRHYQQEIKVERPSLLSAGH